jgi:hypothetical protein
MIPSDKVIFEMQKAKLTGIFRMNRIKDLKAYFFKNRVLS